jgi:hypothetical protein
VAQIQDALEGTVQQLRGRGGDRNARAISAMDITLLLNVPIAVAVRTATSQIGQAIVCFA